MSLTTGVRFPAAAGILLFATACRPALGPGALSLKIKRPEREADHSPVFSVEVKNAWSYTSIPQFMFMA
jgi:hypothetical protein